MPNDTDPTPAPADGPMLPPTEQRLVASRDLDGLPTVEVLRLMNRQDAAAVEAARAVLPQLAAVVDIAAERFGRGGNVHYFGAGTSGRLGMLDAAELLPTFNLEPGRVVGHIAGGARALTGAVEDAEDSVVDGAAAAAGLGAADIAIGLAASGNTPYVSAALQQAGRNGAYTVLVSCNPNAAFGAVVDAHLVLETGPEVLTGSTRLKAATAEKIILNGFSTALMVAVGRTWSNLMVSVVATNAKLRRRTVRILAQAADLDEADAQRLLDETGGDLKRAIVCALAGVDAGEAAALLAQSNGSVAAALSAARAHHVS